MLLEIAIGDAYGAGFEFSAREKILRDNDVARYAAHDLGEIAPGHYTDDTQMSIAVGEALLAGEWTEAAFADRFVATYRRDPRPGYAKGLQKLLDEVENGDALRRRIDPSSRRNGAAMRAVPLGALPNLSDVLDAATANARVTHNTSEGILSSRCVAAMAHFLAHHRAELDALPHLIEDTLQTRMELRWDGEVQCDAMQTVSAATTMLCRERSEKALLLACVDLGGDTDSVAAIALGLASLSREYDRDLPQALFDDLERGAFGSEYLRQIDNALSLRFDLPKPNLR